MSSAMPHTVPGAMQCRIRMLPVLSVVLCCVLAACAATPPGTMTGLDAGQRLQVADAAAASGDHALALSMYQQAADSAPNDTALQLRCATGLARNGKTGAAKDLLIARLKAHPNDSDLLRGLAAIYVVTGLPSPAINELNQALAARPGDSDALLDKAVALDLQGRHAEAQRLYRQMLARTPDDPVISNNLAVSLMIEGRTHEAQAVLAPFADSDDVPDRLRINLGLIYAANGDVEAARRLLGDRLGEADVQTLTRSIASAAPSGQGVQTP
jgi:Flp pilus assembly protein TadD